MIPLLAKNAVLIKVGFENAKMTGNYECAYALGVLSGAAGIPKEEDFQSIGQLKEKVFGQLNDYTTQDTKLNQMIKMLNEYEATEIFDNQMKELYNIGYIDKKL